jgi:hypothetical protein
MARRIDAACNLVGLALILAIIAALAVAAGFHP